MGGHIKMTLLEQIVQQRTHETPAVSATVEKIAAEAAHAILQDPAFRAELKAVAASFGRAMRDVRRQARPGRRKARR